MNVITGCVVVKDNKILLVREGLIPSKLGLKDCYGKWNLPAGRCENFEKVTDGAIREVLEETGFNVKLTGVLPIGERIIKDKTFISVRFTAEIISGEIKYDPNEITEVKWFSIDEIEKFTKEELRSYEYNMNAIKNYKENKIYPVEIFDEKQYIN